MGLLKFLLDTHCWLWLKDDWSRLPSPVRRRILRDPAELVLSAVSVIEIGIKHATGRLKLDSNPDQFVDELKAEGAAVLNVTIGHALRMASLPLHHQDPFDRLLVAQAQVEGLTLVSADPNILAYDVAAIDARK
ncbi:MAG: type II toxin-antitoxin system VapC family toxin [Acidobacteriota bacterium]|nr:type II toxin-antitoxin system VapC family toxin [Acidobacteriota bacterium]